MKKRITSLIDSIVEKNPYDYSLWENIFTVKSESEVFERALEFFPTSPIVWKRYIEYLQSQKNTEEKVLLGIYQRCIHQCSCIMIWKLFIPFVDERINSLKDRYQIYQLALDTVGSDPRSGFIWQRMYKLRLLVYNTLISKNEASLSGNTLLLNPFETSTIPTISDQIEECFALGDKIATIVTLRQFFIHWLTTPVGNLETAFIAYSLFENSISSSSTTDLPNLNSNMVVGGIVSTSESASKLVTKNLLQSGEKLVNISKIVHKNMMVLVEALNEDIPAKPLDKSNRNEWMSKFIPWKRYILFEKSNPLSLDKPQYFNRVSYSYRNCLLYFSYHPEVWYEYFIFVWNSHPIQLTGMEIATELLSSAIQRFLPKDEVLKLVLAEVYELRKKLDKVIHLYHSMVYIEGSGEISQIEDSGISLNDDNNNNNNNNNNNSSNSHNHHLNQQTGNIKQLESTDNHISTTSNNRRSSPSGLNNFIEEKAREEETLNSFARKVDDRNPHGTLGATFTNTGNANTATITNTTNTANTNNANSTDTNTTTDFLLGERTEMNNINKQCSQMITNGMSHKQYNPGVSAVVMIEYLNFVLRSTNDKVIWREIFLDYVKRSPKIGDIKWVCYSQALNEWRLYNNLEGAYQIFYFGMYYRHLFLDVSFMSCFVSFLLDTGKLQQARSTLQSCIYEIYKETGKVPKQLWLQWFNLERMSGSSIYSLNYLNRIYQLQKDGKDVEIDMLLSKRQQEAWHAILGAPEFAELNKEYIGNDNIDPKTKVYGHSFIVNPYDDESIIARGGGGLSMNNINLTQNQKMTAVNSALTGDDASTENVRRSLESNNSNKFILTCPSKFKTAFECFRFGSIYPNSSWTDFFNLNGFTFGESGTVGLSGGIYSQSEDDRITVMMGYCNICSKASSNNNNTNTNTNINTNHNHNHNHSNCSLKIPCSNICTCQAKTKAESKSISSLNDCNNISGKSIMNYNYNNLDLDDDFESFLLEKPFEFRLIQERASNLTSGESGRGGDCQKMMHGRQEDDHLNYYCDDNSDLDNIEDDGFDDEEMEYYYYLNNKTCDFTHINEFKWSRVGRTLCSKPDTSNMVRFRFETYPIKNNSITGVSTQLQSQVLQNTLDNINNGDVLKNIEEMQNFNSSMENTNKSFNTLLPKGIIDFVALLPPRNIPTNTIRNILGISQEIVDLLITNLQTCTLPQKIDIYKYSPMNSLIHLFNQSNNELTNNNNNNSDKINDHINSNNNIIIGNSKNNFHQEFELPRKSITIGTGFTDNISNISSSSLNNNNNNNNLDLNKLQEIIQKSIPWISNNSNSNSNNNNNTFFTPCNVPNPNKFSNKPKNSNSKVQIQL